MLDAKSCRTCQKPVGRKDGGSKLDEVDAGTEITLRTKLHVCVPEMMLADSNEDVICMICTNMLNLSYMFRNICIKTEQTRNITVSVPEYNTKIKKEGVPDDAGIIVTRLQNPPLKSERRSSRSSRSSPAAASAPKTKTASAEQSSPAKKGETGPRNKRGRFRSSKSGGKGHNSRRNVVGVEEMNGVQDEGLADGNNQEPLLEIAYEESVGESDIDRFSTASDYSIGSLRDIPEVIVRDPNTNIAPGGRTLRTRQNVSYVMPPDSPETVLKHKPTSTNNHSSTSTSEKNPTAGNNAVYSDGREQQLGVGLDVTVTKGGRRSGVTANGGRGKGTGPAGGGETKQISPGPLKSKLQAMATLADVDVIDDFCRRTNRDPLEFLCSIPMLKCNSDIGQSAPPHGLMPAIDKFECDLCGQQLSRFQSLRRHRLRHFANYNYHCAICGRNAYERYEIRDHIEQRHNLKPDVVQKYIENSRVTHTGPSTQYRFLNTKSDATTSSTNHKQSNNTASRQRTRTSSKSHPQQTSERRKPGSKHKTEPPAITYNKPGPKSSKIAPVLQTVEPVRSRAGPKSSKVNVQAEAEPATSNVKTAKTPQRMTINTRNLGGNIHLELKRRKINIVATPAVSSKRKRVSQSTTVGSRFKYECVFCDVLVSDKESLRDHLKHYHCNVCFKLFIGKSTKNVHHCLHVPQKVGDENYYLCLDCDDYKSKAHFLSHVDASKTRKVDHLFTQHPRPTFDSHNAEEKRRIVPTLTCALGKNNMDCYFFCGDPDALKFHQVRVHGLTKLLQQISTDKLTVFEQLEKQIRPTKIQPQAGSSHSLSARLQDMQMINYVEDFVDVEALEPRDTDVDPMADVGTERCATCAEEMPNGPLEHECVAHSTATLDEAPAAPEEEVYKCEICLNSFDRLSLIEHMKVHMNI